MGSFSIWHWLIVLLIVVMIFGTKKLKNIGADLGSAVKGFKEGIKEGTTDANAEGAEGTATAQVGNATAVHKETIDVQAHEKT